MYPEVIQTKEVTFELKRETAKAVLELLFDQTSVYFV
jgi:hypothetical protein